MSKDRITLAGICLTTAALPVFADSPTVLETTTVTANRISEQLADTAPNISAVGRKQLDRQHASDLDSLLAQEPGVSVSGDQGRRGNAGVTIRGIETNRILMQVDGTRLPDAYMSGSSAISGRDLVEPDTLRQIDIIKGPASALFGSDAIGGVISQHTFEPADFVDRDKPLHFGLKQSYDGARHGSATTASVAAAGDNTAALLMLTQRRAHQLDTPASRDIEGGQRTVADPQLTDTRNVLAKVALGQDGPHQLLLGVESFDRQRQTELLSARGAATGYTVRDRDSDDDTRRQRYSAEYRYQGDGSLAAANLKLYQQTLRNEDKAVEVRNTGTRYENHRFDQDISGLDGQLEWRLGEHRVLTGVEATRTDTSRLTRTTSGSTTTSSKTFPDNRSERLGLFVQDQFRLGSLTVTPALRYDRYTMTPQSDAIYQASSGGAVPVSRFQDSAWSPRLGLSLPLADGITGFANLSTGFRAPPFDSSFMTFNNAQAGYRIIPNANLKSETSRGIELGSKYQRGSVSGQLTAFYNRYSNFIDTVTLGTDTASPRGIFQYQNLDSVQTHGVEARAGWQASDALLLDSSLAWAHGSNRKTGTPLNSIDPLKATLGAHYQQGQWGSDVLITLVAAKTRAASASQFKAPGYGTLDVGGWLKLGKQTTLRATVHNVGDKKYWQWADVKNVTGSAVDFYAQAGRSVSASLETRF